MLRIDSLDAGSPLVLALYRVALGRGALPYTNVSLSGLGETLLQHGSDEQLTYLSPIQWEEIEHLDALVTIWSETNTGALAVDPTRHAAYIAAQRSCPTDAGSGSRTAR